jgi:hypothetical protein
LTPVMRFFQTTTRILSLLALVAAGACAGVEDDDGTVVLGDPDEEGRSDSAFGKTLHYIVRGDWRWHEDDGRRMRTDTEVLSNTDETLRFRALRIILDLRFDEIMELSVRPASFNDLAPLTTRMAFLLFHGNGRGTWELVSCNDQTYFASVIIDNKARELDVEARTPSGTVVRTHSFEDCGIPENAAAVGLLPFPSSNWFNLKGYYHLDVLARCNGFNCPTARSF